MSGRAFSGGGPGIWDNETDFFGDETDLFGDARGRIGGGGQGNEGTAGVLGDNRGIIGQASSGVWGRWTQMMSSIVGRFIFTIQSCQPSATSCIAAPAALSTAPGASTTVLAPVRFAFSPGTLRPGRSLSGDSEIWRDGFEIESFANKMPQRDDKVVCRYMATLHQFLRRESRQTHLFLCPQKNDVRERRFNRIAHAPAPVRTGHDFDSRSTGQLTQFTEVSRVH